MKTKILLAALFLGVVSNAGAQQTQTNPLSFKTETISSTRWSKQLTENFQDKKQSFPQTQSNQYVRPDKDKRLKRYANSVVGPFAIARTIVGAGVSTWQNAPEEWGENWEGFGRRVASGLAKNAVKQTTIYALDEAFKLDSAFYRSNKKDFGARLGNALISPFTARKADGKRVFGFPRIAGTYASSIIAYEAWYPKRFSYRDGLKNGTISLGFSAAYNVFKEFIWKK